jgi:argininosuccinate lyase
MSSKVSGMLSEELHPVLQREMFEPGLSQGFATLLPLITQINKAHVLMLHAQGILPAATARALAAAILDLEREGRAAFALDPAREDAYFNYEAELIARVGSDVGGRVHIARSRNDLYAAMDRLRARDASLGLGHSLLTLRQALIERARLHRDVLMPGYTHLQPAQPLTFGYYLAGLAHALERDHQRIAEGWPRINVSPLGAGALAGTSFPIDRAATAQWLGFDGVGSHAQDCIASRDYLIELLSGLSLAATIWGRMAQDFFVMTTYEFQTLELPDSVAQTSSMMPQKKNMTALEFLKASSAQVLGAYVTAVAGSRATHFSFVLDACRDAFYWAWDAFGSARRAMAVAELVVASAAPRQERMTALARSNFSTATDLADALVREADLSFRDAHHLVGAVVRAAMDRSLTAERIDAALISDQAAAVLGRRVELDPALVAQSVDPLLTIQTRRNTGGPSSHDMDAMLAGLQERCDQDREILNTRDRRLAEAGARLDEAFRNLTVGVS